ncbi:MAG: hypothetical protein R3A79_04525 [Nannocystaceae bacterium]
MDRRTHAAALIFAAAAALGASACTSKRRPPGDAEAVAVAATTTGATTTGTTGAAEGTTTAGDAEAVALKVTPRPRTIATSGEHTCALLPGGEVACWGAGQYGQLAPGVDDNRGAPVKVPEVRGAVQLALSKLASCALIAGGEVACWGRARSTDGPGRALWRTRKLGDVVELAVARFGATICGRRSDGTAACIEPFGDEAKAVAIPIPEIDDAVTIDSKGGDFCVLRGSRSLECWSSYKVRPDKPVEVTVAATDVVDAAVSGAEHCYRTAAGDQLCASYDTYRAVVPSQGPLWKTRIPGERFAEAADYVSEHGIHCMRDRAGVVRCWGSNRYGELGSGRFAYAERPRPQFPGRKDIAGIGAGGTTTCVRLVEGDLACVEHRYSYNEGVEVAGIRGLAIGEAHACAIVGGEQLRCWGMNDDGCLGVPGDIDGIVRVPGLANVAHVAVGMSHTCASLRDDSVYCWGNGDAGQLGDGRYLDEEDEDARDQTVRSTAPLRVTGVRGQIRDLALGDEFSCAATSVGVYCWGRLNDEVVTVDDAIFATPSLIDAGDYTKLDADGSSLCALRADGELACTGSLVGVINDLSERFDEEALEEDDDEPAPFSLGGPLWRVDGLRGKAIDVAVGESHACYLSDAGIVRCWGDNKEGQLGDGTTRRRTTAVTVVDLENVVEISAGDGHTCARDRGGQVRCWGAWAGPKDDARIEAPSAVVGLAAYVVPEAIDAASASPSAASSAASSAAKGAK